jgi:cytochrome c5
MSQDQQHDAHEAHEGPIKTPKQLAWAVFFAFVVPILVIIMLASAVTSQFKPAAGSDGMEAERIAERLKPVAVVEVKDASDVSSLKAGDAVYAAQCAACHTSGAAGAPKLGDAAAWGPRLKSGYEALLNAALKGKGAMGAQGGGDFSDFEIGRAVVYMANQSGGKLDEPKAPVAASAAQ